MNTALTVPVLKFGGLDLTPAPTFGSCTQQVNITSTAYPFLSAGRGLIPATEQEGITAAFSWQGLWTVVGDRLYLDGTEIAQVLPGAKQWAVVSNRLILFPDKLMVDLRDNTVTQMEAVLESAAMTYTDHSITFGASVTPLIPGDPTRNTFSGDPTRFFPVFCTYGKERSAVTYSGGQWHTPEATAKGLFSFGDTPAVSAGDIIIPDDNGQPIWDNGAAPEEESRRNRNGWIGVVRSVDGIYYQRSYTLHLVFDIFRAASDPGTFPELFRVGDAVELSGFAIPRNNVRGARILSMTEDPAAGTSTVTFAPDTLVTYDAAYVITGEERWTSSYEPVVDIGSAHVRFPQSLYYSGRFTCSPGTCVTWARESNLWHCRWYYQPDGSVGEQNVVELGSYYHTLPTAQDGDSFTVRKSLPPLSYICASGNRLWGVSNRDENTTWDPEKGAYVTTRSRVVYASALGQPDRFYTFDGADTDSYAVAVDSREDFTAMVPYAGDVLCFQERRMYRVSGDYPSNYSLYAYEIPGIRAGCHGSAAVINRYLYYVGTDGIYTFSGSRAYLRSEKLGNRGWSQAVACADGDRYTVSMTDRDGAAGIYALDTRLGLWCCGAEGQASALLLHEGRLLTLLEGRLLGEGEGGLWSATLAPFRDEGFRKLCLRDLFLRCRIPENGWITVEVQGDGGRLATERILSKPGIQSLRIPLGERRADTVTVRLSGKGMAQVEKLMVTGAYSAEEMR